MKVSVVIPTLNAGPLFQEVLEGVKAQDFPGKVELVIVDSKSEDGTAELAKKSADIFFQVQREEFNHGGTRNLAIAHSSGELIALLVQDATPKDRHWLKKLADNFSDPKVAGAYSRQIPRPDCNPLIRLRLKGWSSGQQKKRVQVLEDLKALGLEGSELEDAGGARPLKPEQIQRVIETFSFDNVSSMIRRSVWEEVKFPRRRFAEDIAWAKEVLSRGFKIVYEPDSVVIHSHHKSLWYEFKRIYLDHQNWWQVGRFRIFNRRRELLGASLAGSLRMIRELWQEEEVKDEESGAGGALASKSMISLLGWSLYVPLFVISQNLAQYMGGWAERWKEKYPWYDKIDQRMSKGV